MDDGGSRSRQSDGSNLRSGQLQTLGKWDKVEAVEFLTEVAVVACLVESHTHDSSRHRMCLPPSGVANERRHRQASEFFKKTSSSVLLRNVSNIAPGMADGGEFPITLVEKFGHLPWG